MALRDGSRLLSATLGEGRGGNVTLVAGTLTIDGFNSQIISTTQLGRGAAGDVRVEAQTVTVTNGAQIGSGTFGAGQGGNTMVSAQGTVTVDGFGSISAQGEESLPQSNYNKQSARRNRRRRETCA